MDVTSQYRLKAVDICTSNYGYLLKVSFAGTVIDNHFKFVYIPFGSFPSLLMADFLFARKGEPTAELLNELTEAIRNDLNAHPGFVLFETEEAAREYWTDADLTDETVDATKPLSRDAVIDEASEFADRPITDNDLKIFRQVFLGQRDIVRPGIKVDGSKVAYRIIDGNRLHIDFGNTASRDIGTNPTWVNRQSVEAIREIINGQLLVDKNVLTLDRDIQANHELYVEKQRWEAEFLKTSYQLFINRQRVEAQRDSTRQMVVHRAGINAHKSLSRMTFINHVAPVAVKGVARKLFIEKKWFWGRAKAKQYPGFLVRADLQAQRALDRQLYIQNDQITAKREIRKGPLHIEQDWLVGAKNVRLPGSWNLILLNAGSFGLRHITSDAHIEYGDKVGSRFITHSLYLPKEIQGLRRTDHGLYIPKEIVAKRDEQRKLHIPYEHSDAGGSKAAKDLYIESVQYRAARPYIKDAHVYDGKDLSGDFIKLPYPAVLDDDFHGDKAFYPDYAFLEQEIIAHVERTKGGTLEELFGSVKDFRTNSAAIIENEFWASVIRKLPGYFLEDIVAMFEYYGEIFDDIFVGERAFDGSSWIDLAMEYGITIPERSSVITEEFFIGMRDRLQAIIDSDIPVGIRHNDRFGLIEIGYEGYEEPKPSVIGGELVGHEEPKPSFIGQELIGQDEPRPSVIGKELLGQDIPRPSQIQIENPLGYFEPNPSFIGDLENAQKILHQGELNEQLLAEQPDRPAVIGEGDVGGVDERPSHIDEGLTMDRSTKYSDLDEGLEASVPDRQASEIEESLLGELQKRMALLSTGFVLGELPKDRAGYVTDMYFLGEEGIRQGAIDDGDWIKFAQLALNQAIIEEQMFATNPWKASELLEHILAFTEPFPSHMNEDHVAHTDPFPSHMNEDDVAHKQEHYADVISQIVGDKKLAEAIIEDYIIAQQKIKDGYMPEGIFGTEELKKAFLEEGPVGQSFVYDYTTPQDILPDGYDPEFWDGGFGVPDEYDPHDPFNNYYPWVEELNTPILTQDDWVRFGPGNWNRDKQKGEFYALSETDADGGYFRNDFTKSEYVFNIDFKVEEASGDAAGIVFKYVDDKNYFKFSVYGDPLGNRNMTLHRVVNGQSTWLGSPMNPFIWEQSKWYQLEVSVLGNKVKVKVNGRVQYDLVD